MLIEVHENLKHSNTIDKWTPIFEENIKKKWRKVAESFLFMYTYILISENVIYHFTQNNFQRTLQTSLLTFITTVIAPWGTI